ncbi:hypothetical protein Val02_40490 [Virgisporangium aliadipatigenens]|uniref:DUF1707 domain-containing protein n=1 Tax=Virgisporangium aliadipatigenens TaxID=741659 RepID=A0A8J3YN82_9ACTN|nr:DUF1707 domain-containing protein [Virgisporangium aliadipatigenens]GIJ47163.1 hypothetical protein Val02_40490 [Virgisporangium aliadipatigenens]
MGGGLQQQRVGHAQRAAVLELLNRALEEGYLELHEYENRMPQVTQAKTVHALYAQVADLPPQFRWDPRHLPPAGAEGRRRERASNEALTSVILGAIAIPSALCVGAGGILGIVGAVFGVRALRDGANPPQAIAGIGLGLVGIALSLLVLVITLFG